MGTEEEAVAAVERAMVAIRRSQSRRALSRTQGLLGRAPGLDPTAFAVLDAVEAADAAGDPATVTDVATALGVDQPRASRLVARAVDAGRLARRADQHDGRRALLTLTASGRRELDLVHRRRREVMARAMADWTAHDRATFARLLTAFVSSFADTAASE